MLKTWQIRHCQDVRKLGKNGLGMHKPSNVFLRYSFQKNGTFAYKTKIGYVKKQLFITAFRNMHWVKQPKV